jgi:TPR repeat protein/uncharacterized caspase-like protein
MRAFALVAIVAFVWVAGCSGGGDKERTRGTRAGAASKSSPATKGVPRIWVLAVGVSNYKDASLALEFADRDATAVDGFFASEVGGKVPEDRHMLLVNEQATRAAVLTALTSLSKRTAPDDMIVIFLAMHGMPDPGGDLYYLAHDTDPNALVGTGLPQRDIEYAISRAPARRVVMLADACHAGAAGFAGFRGRRSAALAETNRLVGQIAESKPGTAVLTASSATEASAEGKKWGGGHGVFTHHLLRGLGGDADDDGDGFVTIRELFDFTYRHVSKDTEGNQHPELKGQFDNGMPLAALAGAQARERVASTEVARGARTADPTTPLKTRETSKGAGDLQKACEKEPDACALLGGMYLSGEGVPFDRRGGLAMLSKSCSEGSARACCILVENTYDPNDPREQAEAKVCDDACDSGFGPACRSIEGMRRAGGPRASDRKAAARSKLARELDEKACRSGDAAACHGLAEMLLHDGDGASLERARKLLARACDAGLGRSCELGARSTGYASASARRLLEKACEADFGRGCAGMATVYFGESGRTPNPGQAFTYQRRACDLGVGTSCRACAELAETQSRPAFAVPCLQRSCNWGDPLSCMRLGTMYETGQGTPPNPTMAVSYFNRACAQGHRPACTRRDALQGRGK